EHGGHVTAHRDAFGLCAIEHGNEAFDGFVDRGIDVLAVERLACGSEHGDFGRTNSARTFVALQVRNQHRIAHARFLADCGEDFRGIGELRHPFRTDKAGRLDGLQAAFRQALDQFDLDRRRHDGLFILQTVACANFDDANACRNRAHDFANITSTASASTNSPVLALTDSIFAACDAFRLNSIFIASMTSSSWPSATSSPAFALTMTMRPGIGARTSPVLAV